MKRKTIEEFIEHATKIHKNKYDYSDVHYISCSKKINIICPIHGGFLQTPDNHISSKSGCPSCSILKKPQCLPKTTSQFIKDAIQLHGNRYEYPSEYKTALDKITINCKKHGNFRQTPNSHLNGQGCPSCGNNTKTTEEFIQEASKLHNHRYKYSKVFYLNLITKIPITCDFHGDFLQTPNAHLKGQGCPQCKKSKGELRISDFLNEHCIKFESSKTFNSCINPITGWNLYFDFYVPSKKILIEFDGYQHFAPYYKDKFNIDSLEKRKQRDALKTKWAKNNGYTLIRIKYTKMKEIPSILTAMFKN